MINWNTIQAELQIAQTQHQAIMEANQRARQIKTAARNSKQQPVFFNSSVRWLGDQLVKWGNELQTHFEVETNQSCCVQMPYAETRC